MSEINVLVSNNVTPKVKGGVVSTDGNSVTDNSAAMEFAAIFGGWITQAIGQGQDSGLQSVNPAGKEANSGQTGIQGLEGMLNSLRTIAGLNLGSVTGQVKQDNAPVMKAVGQEINSLLTQDNLLGDVADSGIGSGQLQGGKSPLTELDQYRVLITQLLQDMSGEISQVSFKPTDIQGLLTELSQEINLNTSSSNSEKSALDVGELNSQSIIGQVVQKILTENVDPVQNQTGQTDLDQVIKELQFALQGKNDLTQTESKSVAGSQAVSADQFSQANDIQIGPQNMQSRQSVNTAQLLDLRNQIRDTQSSNMMTTQNSDKMQESALRSNPNYEMAEVKVMPLKGNLTQNSNSAQNDLSNQNQNISQHDGLLAENQLLKMNIETKTAQNGTGNEKNDLGDNKNNTNNEKGAEGSNSIPSSFNLTSSVLNSVSDVGISKSVTQNLPVWLQVAQELQAKVLHQFPTVRELNIQLHPAELGQITISLTLDNGQVNLHMMASEAATGQILQNNFQELRDNLMQSGVQCGMMQMDFTNSNQNFNQGRNQAFNLQTKNQTKEESDHTINRDEIRLDVFSKPIRDQEISQNNARINVMA